MVTPSRVGGPGPNVPRAFPASQDHSFPGTHPKEGRRARVTGDFRPWFPTDRRPTMDSPVRGGRPGPDVDEEVEVVAMSKASGLSVWEAEVLEHVTQHARAEGELLSAYRRLGEESKAEWVQYVSGIVEEDEVRHHRFFEELANALRAPVERGLGESVPFVTNVADPAALLEATERLLEAEKRDVKELKRMSRRLRSMRGVSLWPLLVEVMLCDTEKHMGILRFVRDQLRGQRSLRH